MTSFGRPSLITLRSSRRNAANYVTGAGTALSIDGLTTAEVAFMDQVDSDGKPIGIMPAILLVPTALSAVGTAAL